MAFTDVTEDAGYFRTPSFFGYNELGGGQSCFDLRWQDIPDGLLPWYWVASSSGSLTANSTSFQGSHPSMPDFKQPRNTEIPNSLLDKTGFGSVQPSFASYTVQQSSAFIYPIQETPTGENIAPNFSQNRDSQGSLDSLKASDLNRAHSVLEPYKKEARGRKPRQRQPLCDTKSPQERRTQLNNAKNRQYLNALERNRHAAAKCCARKQDQENALASEVEVLEGRHQQLSSCHNNLIEPTWAACIERIGMLSGLGCSRVKHSSKNTLSPEAQSRRRCLLDHEASGSVGAARHFEGGRNLPRMFQGTFFRPL
ncbi:hypothetical protein FOVG_17665 [Fusarium oxysporum f. sp. pisi HDV247]|uniref:BZIP domain-containing protein n=1 Tax=Fusarium oxysporum f. sp. pisi HDV247 TaxID=1080344 RepID=W9NLZ7_FUSOX|nr:hypothetical protein FOVG_17665 [Fusarium oxysporum f. sp. pisi HDV247]